MNEQGKKISITVTNEDDGREGVVEATPNETVRAVIEKVYAQVIHRAAQPGDRLRCAESGQDVLVHSDKHIAAYVASECRGNEWLFAGQTGGA